jgi:hypothetical protein
MSYHYFFKIIDKGAIEHLGPLGVTLGLKNFIFEYSKMHNGLFFNYCLLFIGGTLILMLLKAVFYPLLLLLLLLLALI